MKALLSYVVKLFCACSSSYVLGSSSLLAMLHIQVLLQYHITEHFVN